jgi:hypothetical protein
MRVLYGDDSVLRRYFMVSHKFDDRDIGSDSLLAILFMGNRIFGYIEHKYYEELYAPRTLSNSNSYMIEASILFMSYHMGDLS